MPKNTHSAVWAVDFKSAVLIVWAGIPPQQLLEVRVKILF